MSSNDNVIPDSIVDKLKSHATSYASANGIQIEKRRTNDDGSISSYFECAPMSLLPNAYPKDAFLHAKSLAPSFNLLVDRVSRDYTFLESTLGGVGGVTESDPFTAKLLQLYKEIYIDEDESKKPNFAKIADRMGIHRSDYMLHSYDSINYQIKQVELNTIASSFAGLSANVAKLHRHLLERFSNEKELQSFLQTNKKIVAGNDNKDDGENRKRKRDDDVDGDDIPDQGVPVNPALTNIPSVMQKAHERYVNRFCKDDKKTKASPCILFVVQEGESNTVDQRMLEFELWDQHKIPVVRMSLTKANEGIILDEKTGALVIKESNQEVAVVYYRAGYAPTDYPDGDDGIEWVSREKFERSRATKSPALGYHLAGTKKVQQQLARPDVLEKFMKEENTESMRSAFAGLYSLNQEDVTQIDIEAVKDVIMNNKQSQFVLKPQREGGGYNFYGEKLFEKLKQNVTITTSDDNEVKVQLDKKLGEFILMERLFPPKQNAVLLRSGKIEPNADPSTISELGCFGTILVSDDGNDVLCNEYAGFLLRTKFSNVDEGGVASGFATLSSPYLC